MIFFFIKYIKLKKNKLCNKIKMIIFLKRYKNKSFFNINIQNFMSKRAIYIPQKSKKGLKDVSLYY